MTAAQPGRSIALQRTQKALNVASREEKTEITVMMGMQNAIDVAAAAGVEPSWANIIEASKAEQPACQYWLVHLLAYVRECGANGELLKDLGTYTKAAARVLWGCSPFLGRARQLPLPPPALRPLRACDRPESLLQPR